MGDTDAILADAYSSIYRIAAGLSGRVDLARKIVAAVIIAALRERAGWQRLDEPIKWFRHYTVLTARAAKSARSPSREDLLIPPEAAQRPVYPKFVAALRSLHRQQMEAFLLRYGENLDPRQLGVAMDCSMTAAANHLEAAQQRLTLAVGPQAVMECTSILADAYAALTPPTELHLKSVNAILRRQKWSGAVKTAGAIVAALAVAAACLYGISRMSR